MNTCLECARMDVNRHVEAKGRRKTQRNESIPNKANKQINEWTCSSGKEWEMENISRIRRNFNNMYVSRKIGGNKIFHENANSRLCFEQKWLMKSFSRFQIKLYSLLNDFKHHIKVIRSERLFRSFMGFFFEFVIDSARKYPRASAW